MPAVWVTYAIEDGEVDIRDVLFSRLDAEAHVGCEKGLRYAPATLQTLNEVVESYFDFRGYLHPRPERALWFFLEELGELARALNSDTNWKRNHPERHEVDADLEAGDALMMFIKWCEELGIDPLQGMLDKWREKGWGA